jgi:hypothetical protein
VVNWENATLLVESRARVAGPAVNGFSTGLDIVAARSSSLKGPLRESHQGLAPIRALRGRADVSHDIFDFAPRELTPAPYFPYYSSA